VELKYFEGKQKTPKYISLHQAKKKLG